MGSVGYRVLDPTRGKVFNVGVPHIDETVQSGWWRKENNGEGPVDDIGEIIYPDLGVAVVGEETKRVQEGDPPMPALVEDSSDDEGGDDGGDEDGNGGGGDDDSWGPDDDTLALIVHEGLAAEEGEGSQEPRHSNRENRGVPPLRYIEAYLAGAAEEEAKHTPQSVQVALQGDNKVEWKKAMDSEMASLRENGV